MTIEQATENLRNYLAMDGNGDLKTHLHSNSDLMLESLNIIQGHTQNSDQIDIELAALLYELGIQCSRMMKDDSIDKNEIPIEQVFTHVDIIFHMGRMKKIKK